MSFKLVNTEFQDRWSIIAIPCGLWIVFATFLLYSPIFDDINLPSKPIIFSIVISLLFYIIAKLLSYTSEFTFTKEGITEIRKSIFYLKRKKHYSIDCLKSVQINSYRRFFKGGTAEGRPCKQGDVITYCAWKVCIRLADGAVLSVFFKQLGLSLLFMANNNTDDVPEDASIAIQKIAKILNIEINEQVFIKVY